MRFTLSQIMTVVLVMALSLALFVNHHRSQREIHALRHTLAESRDYFEIVEYGRATLHLLELHPAIHDDADCLRFIRHELAFSVLQHWEDETAIDDAVDTPGYAKTFTARALSALDCKSASEFIALTKSTLWIYPDDHLYETATMLGTQFETFDAFVESAISDSPNR